MSRKLSIEEVRAEFSSAGLELLSVDYIGVNKPLLYRCKSGHTHKMSLTVLRRGVRCPYCAGNKKLTLEQVREVFSNDGYCLLAKSYNNNKELLKYRCTVGHEHSISFGKFKAGRRCPTCARKKVVRKTTSLSEAREEFTRVGYTPLFEQYSGVNQLLQYRCSVGHKSFTRLKDLRRGARCPSCVGGVRLSLEEAAEEFKLRGFTLLADSYINNRTPMPYECSKKHRHEMSLSNAKAGSQCPTCSRKVRNEKGVLHIDEVRKRFFDLGYTPLFDDYVNSFTKVPFLCDKGHYHEIMPYTLLNGVRCKFCSNSGFSKNEKELVSFFKEYNLALFENYRKLIGPSEVDIYFPEKGVAVEYCGLHWHSEVSGKKLRKYHYTKMKKCQEKGVRLITVFEDEYLTHREVVLSRIKNSLGICENRIYSRKCTVKEIDSSAGYAFLEKYHLQGASGGVKIYFGLFYYGELVGVAAAGALTRKHISRKKEIELKRLCFLPGYSVVGGASKLFKPIVEFSRDNGFSYIRSYQDMRYGNPFKSVYDVLGFDFLGESKYTPHYIKNGVRYRNYKMRKTLEERETGKTEWELRRNQGYDRIWDCGHRTYVYKL